MKKCITLAIPIMLQTLVVSSVNLVDNLMVGKLGDTALSAVVSANKYYAIINFAINAIIASCVIFMSQFYGAKNINKMKETYRFSFIASYIIIFTVFIIVFLFPSQLIAFIINDPDIIASGTIYLKYASFSYLPMGISMCIAGSMRVIGDSKTPMYISASSIVINAILDYSLIFGKFGLPELGIAGAAIATIIARIIESTIYYFVSKNDKYVYKTELKDLLKFDYKLAKNIIIKALPLLTNEILWQFGMTVLFKAYSSRGPVYNTAYSISSTVSEVFFILFSGMAVSTTILVGQPLGANKLEEARDNGYKLIIFSEIISLIFGISLYSSQYLITFIYPNVSIESLAAAQHFLRYMGIMYLAYMFNTQCYFTLRAGGDTRNTMFMDSGFMWCFNIPVVFLLAYKTNISIYTVFLIGQSTDIVKAFFSYRLVRKEKWVKNLAIENK